MKFASLVLLSLLASAQEITLTQVASGISAPADIQSAKDGSGRLFLVQQNGVIKILKNGSVLSTPFLSITSKTVGTGERGLLGLAFPVGYASKQRFYVNYTNLAGNTVIAMYRANGDVADASSETILLTITQPFANHNGGQIRFGPDGYLYIGMGDGGSAGDPQGNGQRRDTLLGKMLRVDVESDPGRVSIPPSNPFVGVSGVRGEIWAYGLRNPWRFSFDRQTNDLWTADVGQNEWEEIDFQPAASKGGENYGWNITEGQFCFNPVLCSKQGLTLPVWQYSHSENNACSVTGGFVYRGALYPKLRGTYVFGDYCNGRIWGLLNGTRRELRASGYSITTFGEDEQGEIYLANAANGTIHRIESSRAPALVNAASFAPSGLVAGSLMTVFTSGVITEAGVVRAERVPLPTSLGGVTVTVNGTAVPLLAVANVSGLEQANFQVPFTLSGTNATVLVRHSDSSGTLDLPIATTAPGVYTADGQAIVVRANYTLVTPANPLAEGEFVYLYASGLAQPANSPPTGAAAPLAPLATTAAEVLIGGVNAPIQFAGLAPGFVGLYQVNFRVPAGVPSGNASLQVRAGGVTSAAASVPVR